MTEEEIQKIKEHIEIHARREPGAVKITRILWKAVEELEATNELQEEIAELKSREYYVGEINRENMELHQTIHLMENRISELEEKINKMKKYAKLLQDICVVLGNDDYMVAVQLEGVVKHLWDTSEEKEGLEMCDDILNRLLEIKVDEWAEITKWG